VVWCEVSAAAPVDQVELVAEALRAVAPGGVSIEDPVVPLGPEEGVRLDRRRPSVVRAYLPVDDALGERLNRLDDALAALGLRPELHTRTVHEEDWADAWKKHFHVERVGERIVIRPSWRPYAPQPDDVVIDLDPGMAFGTGQHPTTRMCLELLERTVRPGDFVLDVGAGSGILAIAAVKLGAARCLALDVDPQAVTVARENAARNGVDVIVRVEAGSLGAGWTLSEPPPRGADLAVANITATAVAGLAPAFAAALRPGGILIGSGIVAERTDEVLTALHAAGFTVGEVRAEGDWRAIAARVGTQPPPPTSPPPGER
jgi:ribosomal protein L11 methyltransferase